MWSRVREHVSIRRGRTDEPPAAANEHARPAAAGPEAAPADGKAEVPAAGGAAEVSSEAVGTQVVPANGKAQPPAADAVEEHTPRGQADDPTAPSQNGDTLVLPLLADIDEVTAPPGAEQP